MRSGSEELGDDLSRLKSDDLWYSKMHSAWIADTAIIAIANV